MKTQHTPGPWKFSARRPLTPEEGGTIYVHNTEGRVADHICYLAKLNNEGSVAANSHLIAAAPELAEALQACLAVLDVAFNSKVDGDVFGIHHNDATDALQMARAALAKAFPQS